MQPSQCMGSVRVLRGSSVVIWGVGTQLLAGATPAFSRRHRTVVGCTKDRFKNGVICRVTQVVHLNGKGYLYETAFYGRAQNGDFTC